MCVSASEQAEGPDWRRNLLKGRLRDAVSVTAGALLDLGASNGNPLADVAARIEEGWVASESPTRTNFVTDLHGAGDGVRQAFTAAREDLWNQVGAEDDWIDVETRPHEEWKTSTTGIDTRISSPHPRRY